MEEWTRKHVDALVRDAVAVLHVQQPRRRPQPKPKAVGIVGDGGLALQTGCVARGERVRGLITLDSSVIEQSDNGRAVHHLQIRAVIVGGTETRLLPAATLGELGHRVERRFGYPALLSFVSDPAAGVYGIDLGLEDLERVQESIERYHDRPPGLVDTAVAACAERNGGRLLTTDFRHFGVVVGEGTLTLVQ